MDNAYRSGHKSRQLTDSHRYGFLVKKHGTDMAKDVETDEAYIRSRNASNRFVEELRHLIKAVLEKHREGCLQPQSRQLFLRHRCLPCEAFSAVLKIPTTCKSSKPLDFPVSGTNFCQVSWLTSTAFGSF